MTDFKAHWSVLMTAFPENGQRRLIQPMDSVTLNIPAQVVAVQHVGHPFFKRRRTFFVRRNTNRIWIHDLCQRPT